MLLKIFIILFLVYIFMIHGKNVEIDRRPYAHRGFHTKDKQIPENTLAAFNKAKKYGYGIELDVQLSHDGHVMVFHDETLKRMSGDIRKLSDLSKAELEKIDIYGHQIPSLGATLDAINGAIPLIIELKSHGDHKVLCEKTAEILDQYHGDFVIESFDPRIVFWFRKNRPTIRRGILIMNVKKYGNNALGLLINSLVLNVLLRPHFIALAKDVVDKHPSVLLYRYLGGNIVVWTILEKDSYRKDDIIIFEYFRA